MDRISFTCACCQTATNRYYQARNRMCLRCSDAHQAEGRKAVAAVQLAVRSGALRPAADCVCADCGAKAAQYDHRDYTQPLAVEPVCRSCNQKRGPAYDSAYRPEQKAA